MNLKIRLKPREMQVELKRETLLKIESFLVKKQIMKIAANHKRIKLALQKLKKSRKNHIGTKIKLRRLMRQR